MSKEILVPDIGDFESVEIIEILVKIGDKIKKNDSVVTLESDKSSVEVPATIEGTVEKINAKVLPHVGWNSIDMKKKSPIFTNIKNPSDFYFVNSYAFNVKDKNLIISETNYENTFCSAVQKDNIFGVQFHPEKSQKTGQQLIHNFLKL